MLADDRWMDEDQEIAMSLWRLNAGAAAERVGCDLPRAEAMGPDELDDLRSGIEFGLERTDKMPDDVVMGVVGAAFRMARFTLENGDWDAAKLVAAELRSHSGILYSQYANDIDRRAKAIDEKRSAIANQRGESEPAIDDERDSDVETRPRKYTTKPQAEAEARKQFHALKSIDNKTEWARRIRCDRRMIGELSAWKDGENFRGGLSKLKSFLRTLDPHLMQDIYSHNSDLSQFSVETTASLPEHVREWLDELPAEERAEMIALVSDQVRETVRNSDLK